MAMPKNQVGFECEFVKAPVDYLQSECPICLHILREPYQVTCCGKSFCRRCIERVKGSHKPCPCCNKENFNDFPNLGLQQPLYGFEVYCVNKEDGCNWKGELGQLDNHLNLNPVLGNFKELREGCKLAKIECSYCSNFIVRNELLHHKSKLCDKRPFSCEHCNEYKSTFEDVVHNHWPVCGCYPVQCPNNCGTFPERQKLDDHVGKECPLTVVECDFHYAGCEVRLPRRNMPDHLKDGLVAHFSLLAVSHSQLAESRKQQQEEIQAYQKEIKVYQKEMKALEMRQEDKMKTMRGEIDELKKQTEQLRLNVQMIYPIDFRVENVHKCTIGNSWSSTPFYSHSQGYKLRINILNHSCLIITCQLMRGGFDSLLQWPLKAEMKLALLNQQPQGKLFNIGLKWSKPVQDGGAVSCGSCNLGSYRYSGCLHIRIISIQF